MKTIRKVKIVSRWIEYWFEDGTSFGIEDKDFYHHATKIYTLEEVMKDNEELRTRVANRGYAGLRISFRENGDPLFLEDPEDPRVWAGWIPYLNRPKGE